MFSLFKRNSLRSFYPVPGHTPHSNAGVTLSGVTELTWIVAAALIIGKTVGVVLFSLIAQTCDFPLPSGMTKKDLVMAGAIAGLGLTVALFVAGQAFTDPAMQGAAKMGALLSVLAAGVAWQPLPLSFGSLGFAAR